MPIIESSQMSPREHLEHEWRLDEFQKQAAHAVTLKKLDIEIRKAELKLRLADSQASRKSLELRQKLELQTREVEAHYSQLFRIPLTIIKLPVYIILAVGATIRLAKDKEIPTAITNILK